MHAGLIGLGAGTLAACAREGDTFRFYEINPLVVDLARSEFTYLKDSRGVIEIVVADGRLGLERDAQRRFRILVVDAFSGDSIPVHLLTREAFELYFERLEPDGVLALHVSNTALDIAPVVERIVSAMNKAALLFVSGRDPSLDRSESVWVLVTNEGQALAPLRPEGQPLPVNPRLRAWTDDYSNLFQILK
jgi:spermidine synthase